MCCALWTIHRSGSRTHLFHFTPEYTTTKGLSSFSSTTDDERAFVFSDTCASSPNMLLFHSIQFQNWHSPALQHSRSSLRIVDSLGLFVVYAWICDSIGIGFGSNSKRVSRRMHCVCSSRFIPVYYTTHAYRTLPRRQCVGNVFAAAANVRELISSRLLCVWSTRGGAGILRIYIIFYYKDGIVGTKGSLKMVAAIVDR